MEWRPVMSVPHLLPQWQLGEAPAQPRPCIRLSGYRKWMGWHFCMFRWNAELSAVLLHLIDHKVLGYLFDQGPSSSCTQFGSQISTVYLRLLQTSSIWEWWRLQYTWRLSVQYIFSLYAPSTVKAYVDGHVLFKVINCSFTKFDPTGQKPKKCCIYSSSEKLSWNSCQQKLCLTADLFNL